jgi:LysR family transcriptional regulator, regulator of abg operon
LRLKQVEDFLAVVECGSMRGAARALGVSQPAITRSVRRLETDLGANLLQRTPHGITLTECGGTFFRRVRAAHAELQKAQNEVKTGTPAEGCVSFGVGPTVGSLVVPHAVASFRIHFPRVRLQIVEGFPQHVAPLVRDGTLDFGVGPRPQRKGDSSLTLKPLFTHELAIVARKGHALRRARSLKELSGAEWASLVPSRSGQSPVTPLFASAGLAAPGNIVECDSYHLFVSLLANTSMLGLLTRKLVAERPARDCLAVIEIEEVLPSYTIYLYSRTGIPLASPAAALAKAVASAARRLAARNTPMNT